MIQQDEMRGGVKVCDLVEHLQLAVVNKGDDFDTALVGIRDVNRPGLQLVGFFDYFDPRRLQVIGMAETKMLESMEPEHRSSSFSRLFEYDIPALVVSRDLDIYPECLAMARKHRRTLLHTTDTTVVFTTKVIEYLSQALAPTITRHGGLLDIYGEGVLITGDSGVGKSETAIELIKRGHRLVADDAVDIRRVADQLLGKAPELIRHYIELRGIGVVDVQQLLGMSAVKPESQVDLVIHLERWREDKFYDRLGLDEEKVNILGIELPIITIPVQPGRNLATIVEVAVMNNRHKKYGFNAAQQLADELERHVQGA
jgi:HPr kinase/phosphorylase